MGIFHDLRNMGFSRPNHHSESPNHPLKDRIFVYKPPSYWGTTYDETTMWVFPQIGLPSVMIQLNGIFSINQPFWGSPQLRKPPFVAGPCWPQVSSSVESFYRGAVAGRAGGAVEDYGYLQKPDVKEKVRNCRKRFKPIYIVIYPSKKKP